MNHKTRMFVVTFAACCLLPLIFLYIQQPHEHNLPENDNADSTQLQRDSTLAPVPADAHQMQDTTLSLVSPETVASPTNEPKSNNPNKSNPDDYIVDCSSAYNDLSPEEHQLELLKHQSILSAMADSTLTEKQLAYALFAELPQGKSRLDLLSSFYQQHPDNGLVLMEMLNQCIATPENNHCNEQLVNEAIALNGTNGALWFQLANFRVKQGNRAATFEAIREMLKSAYFDNYYHKNIAIFMNATAGESNLAAESRFVHAIGFEGAKTIPISEITQFCRKESANSNIASQLCFDMGKRLEHQAKTILLNAIGSALQDISQEAELINQGLAVQARKDRHNRYDPFNGIDINQFNKATALSFFDEQLFWGWFNNQQPLGERQAAQLLIKEAIDLSKNPDYLPCSKKD